MSGESAIDRQTDRASWWSLTINNPTDEERQKLKMPPRFVKRVVCQDEVGENGTLHIQAGVNTQQVRFSAVKKWLPRAHIEIAKNPAALIEYCKKEDTSIAGTQLDITASVAPMSMSGAMAYLAGYYDPSIYQSVSSRPEMIKKGYEAIQSEVYWIIVRKLLKDHPDTVALYTQPQYLRTWIHTSEIWIKIAEENINDASAQEGTPTPSTPKAPRREAPQIISITE